MAENATATNPEVTPVMETPVAPAQAAPVAAKSGKGKGIFAIIVVLLLLIILGVVGVGGFLAYSSVKNSYVPVISPIMEDIVLKPHEQFAQRFDVYEDISAKLIQSDAQSSLDNVNQSLINDLTNSLDSLEMDSEIKYSIKNLSALNNTGVLGIDDEAGSLDEDSLMDLLSSKQLDIIATTKSKSAGLKEGLARAMSENEIKIVGDNNEVKAKFDMYTEASDNMSDIYFYLYYFPTNPYLVTDSIEKMWIKYSVPNTEELLNSLETIDSSTNDTATDTDVNDQLAKLKELVHHPVMEKVITAAPSQNVNGAATKCYNMTIDENNYQELMAAIKEIYPETADEQLDEDEVIPTMKFTFCFDNQLIIRKVEFDIDMKDVSESTLSGYLQINSFNQAITIETPQDTTDFNDIDWTKVIPMLSMLNQSMTQYDDSDYDMDFDMDYDFDTDMDYDFDNGDFDFDFDMDLSQ